MEDFDPSLCREEAFVLRKLTKWLGTRSGLTLSFLRNFKNSEDKYAQARNKGLPKGSPFCFFQPLRLQHLKVTVNSEC